MSQTLVGVFRNLEDAVEARTELRQKGFADSAIRLHESAAALGGGEPEPGAGVGQWLKSLFSLDEDYVGMYSEAVRRGHHLLAVTAEDDAQVQTAAEVMERCRCIDVLESTKRWRDEGWQGPQPAASERVVVVRRVQVVATRD